MLIRPQRNFTVVRQIANHLDTETYYVQAIIRDAFTDEILETLNLEDKGGQRFTKAWLVAQDPSGEGRDISIVTSVYTDSGYTTKSENYGDEENTHTIEARIPSGRGGGGSLSSTDIKRVVSTLLDERDEKKKKEESEKEVEEEEEPEEVIDRTDEIISAINNLAEVLKPKEADPVDFTPVLNALNTVAQMIVDKEVTTETDLNPILEAVQESLDKREEMNKSLVEILKSFKESVQSGIDKSVSKAVKGVKWKSTFKTEAVSPEGEGDDSKEVEKPEQEEEMAFDINKLTS